MSVRSEAIMLNAQFHHLVRDGRTDQILGRAGNELDARRRLKELQNQGHSCRRDFVKPEEPYYDPDYLFGEYYHGINDGLTHDKGEE